MERGSKLAITKLKLVEPKNGQPFYSATVCEKVYNQANPFNKWETAFYDAYIFNMELGLEPAEFTLNKNPKDKYSYDNIANPEKSVIRVIDFKYENHTMWKGQEQVKDNDGYPSIKRLFYLTEIELNKGIWKSEERKSKELEKKLDELKEKYNQIKAENTSLRLENKKLEQVINKNKEMLSEVKNNLKQANYQTMVYKRKNTITNNNLERTQNKLAETKEDLKTVKRMKKEEVIRKANEFVNNEFDFGEL